MSTTLDVTTSQAAILGRSILPDHQEMTIPMARFLVDIHFSPEDHQRMVELSGLARRGELSAEEAQLIDDYRRPGHLLETIKSHARLVLTKAHEAR
jgi:hypothetical protein